jgi:hypothetical protein
MNVVRSWFFALINKLWSVRERPVRTMFSLIGIALFLSAAVATSQDASYIKLESNESVIEQGHRFSIKVFAFAHVPVNAVDVTLRFDSNIVSVIGVDRGQSVLTIWTEDPVIQSDRVILRGGTFRKGFLGEHLVANIELQAKETGQGKFSAANVLLLAGDGRGTPVKTAPSNNSELTVLVFDENTSPENIGATVSVLVVTDLDGDGTVSLRDISSFMASWAAKDKTYDFNGDGRMTFRDFSILLSDFFSKR